MKIGIVCPYSFDVPGGVQQHIIDLRAELARRGHDVAVLAPAVQAQPGPWFTAVSGAIAVPYNGSVARLAFGPRAVRATKQWLDAGQFDIVHIHEPASPSVSMLALQQVKGPVVATFHTAMDNSAALKWSSRLLAPMFEKLGGRIAVSAEARRTLIQHQGGDAVIIPNGVETSFYRKREKAERPRPLVSFLGRLDEERKGLPLFAAAAARLLDAGADIDFKIAGRGDAPQIRAQLAKYGDRVEFLGGVSDDEKAQLLADSDVYVAPQTGGESFGIVLVEAMAAGSCVLASDIPAFSAVLQNGESGALFANDNAQDLAEKLNGLLADDERRISLAQAGQAHSLDYDWQTVTDQIELVYRTVLG